MRCSLKVIPKCTVLDQVCQCSEYPCPTSTKQLFEIITNSQEFAKKCTARFSRTLHLASRSVHIWHNHNKYNIQLMTLTLVQTTEFIHILPVNIYTFCVCVCVQLCAVLSQVQHHVNPTTIKMLNSIFNTRFLLRAHFKKAPQQRLGGSVD